MRHAQIERLQEVRDEIRGAKNPKFLGGPKMDNRKPKAVVWDTEDRLLEVIETLLMEREGMDDDSSDDAIVETVG